MHNKEVGIFMSSYKNILANSTLLHCENPLQVYCYAMIYRQYSFLWMSSMMLCTLDLNTIMDIHINLHKKY